MEHTFLGKEIKAGNQHGQIIAHGGCQPHAKHAAMEDKHIEDVQSNVCNGHGEHRCDQNPGLPRHLQERDQHQRAHGSRCSNAETTEIIPCLFKKAAFASCPHEVRQR